MDELDPPLDGQDREPSPYQKATFLLEQALIQDEAGRGSEALPLYRDAAGGFMDAFSQCSDAAEKLTLQHKVASIRDRAEQLKGISKPVGASSAAGKAHPAPRAAVAAAAGVGAGAAGGARLSPEEIEVLKRSSLINGRIFQPWLAMDLQERFNYLEPFTDPDGRLALSPKQRGHLKAWKRPSQYMGGRGVGDEPKMIELLSPYSIVQVCGHVVHAC